VYSENAFGIQALKADLIIASSSGSAERRLCTLTVEGASLAFSVSKPVNAHAEETTTIPKKQFKKKSLTFKWSGTVMPETEAPLSTQAST